MVMCSVEYKTSLYDNSVAVMKVAEDQSASITLRGNRYASWVNTVGIYRFPISAKEYDEICSMLDAEEFRKKQSPKGLTPGDSYQSLIFKKTGQSIERHSAGVVELTPYMKDVFIFFQMMFMDNIKSRQPAIGLSCSIENLKADVDGQIQFTVAIINKGKIPFSIPAFGAEGCIIDVGITSSDVYFGIDDKYVTRIFPAAKDNQILLRPGEQYKIDYSIDKSELPAGYRGISIELSLPLIFENNEKPQGFSLFTRKRF